ncbi:metal ABC transporter substrate-binding protein [Brackiella oedipodis]|uniref:metal ABC transporter substrate-binding protein n=1 Tax=Brackiella oedipodis TaxID=124225 RepID=UPI00048FBA23|nr:metal ABC transporter substrate-binding protein [Brackiella oedipodis]
MRKVLLVASVAASLLVAAMPTHAKDKLKVVTTFTVIQDIAQNVAGNAADVESITKVGAEIHEYQPTPKDILKAQQADLILHNGLNLEKWFERFYANIKDRPSVVVTEGITPINIQNGEAKGDPNPHAWMSPQNALIYVDNIRKALIKYDPDHADTYNHNAQQYTQKIKSMAEPLKQKLLSVPQGKRWLVTSEGAFSYLVRDYDFKELYLWPVNSEQEGTPQQVKKVIDTVRQHHIPVVFSESTVSSKPMKQVVKETGAAYGGILYVDSLSASDGPTPTYLDLLNTTVSTIVKGFEAHAQ